MKTQNSKTTSYSEHTYLVARKKSRPFMEKFTEWFRSFLENSE